jgi:hypothetical protein
LVARVSEAVDGINANHGLRRRDELNVNLLPFYGVAGAQSDSTSGEPISSGKKQEEQKGACVVDRKQDSPDCKSDEAAEGKPRFSVA